MSVQHNHCAPVRTLTHSDTNRRTKSVGEIVKAARAKLRHGQQWGTWRLDAYRLVLEYVPGGIWRYEIDLETICDSAVLLDWVFQTLGRDMDTVNMLEALADIFHPQANLCSFGVNKQLPKGFLATRIEPPTEVQRQESYHQAHQFYKAWGLPIVDSVEGQDHESP